MFFLLLKYKCKHIEIYIEYRKNVDNIEISILFNRPALNQVDLSPLH